MSASAFFSRAVHLQWRLGLILRRLLFRLSPARFALGACGSGSLILPADLIAGHESIFLGRNVFIRQHARLEVISIPGGHRPRLEIADGVHAEFYLHIACAEQISIGRSVLIAGRVYITDHDHGAVALDVPVLSTPLTTAPTIIEDYAWLGEGAVILKGVTVGKNAIVGANSVVTRSVPANAIVAGAPARIIRYRENAATASAG